MASSLDMSGSRLRAIPSGVWALGFVSLLMDTSSEMIHALLPVYLVTAMGASMLTVGVIEGVAEATAAITKIFSGALSDRLGKRKLLAALGYGLAAITKPVFPLAPSIEWLFAARFVDRIGKGLRGAPRDALVADLSPPELRGASFGLRQALDTVGAFLGPLACHRSHVAAQRQLQRRVLGGGDPGFPLRRAHRRGGARAGPAAEPAASEIAAVAGRARPPRPCLLVGDRHSGGVHARPLQRGLPHPQGNRPRPAARPHPGGAGGDERRLCAGGLSGWKPLRPHGPQYHPCRRHRRPHRRRHRTGAHHRPHRRGNRHCPVGRAHGAYARACCRRLSPTRRQRNCAAPPSACSTSSAGLPCSPPASSPAAFGT